MTDFKDRERAEEAHLSLELDQAFKVRALRDRKLGLWVAERLGLDERRAAAYAGEVTNEDVEHGETAMVAKVLADLGRKGAELPSEGLRALMADYEDQARQHVLWSLTH